jgi:tetratricopeptide (TPR) repeat protein
VAGRIAEIDQARTAVERKAWSDAYQAFRVVDPSDLTPEDWEQFSDSAWWTGRIEESIAARQKAYTGYVEAGEERPAAWMAARLCIEQFLRDEPAVGAGWFARMQRHAKDLPDCVELGFAAFLEATILRFTGDLASALPLAERAHEIGRRFGDRNLLGLAIHTQGLILISQGRVAEGVTLLDEAMTSVVAGELSDYFTGAIYCNVIAACLELADVRRAGDWGEAARAWAESIPPESPYPGMCRINRAQLASLRGDWPQAEAEAVRATEELLSFNPALAGEALYETGDVRRRLGDLAGAEAAFEQAHELGFEPQPGLALLRLAQGKVDAALTALRTAVMGASGNGLRRARLQGALADAALAAGDLDAARAAADEADSIARETDARCWRHPRPRSAGRSCWPTATCPVPWRACVEPVLSGRSSGCRTSRRAHGRSTASRSAPPATRTTPGSSCVRRSPPLSGWGPRATLPRPPTCWEVRRPYRAGSRLARQRSCAWSPRARRTATSRSSW